MSEGTPAPHDQAATEAQARERRRPKRLGLVLGSVACAAALAVLWGLASRHRDENALEQQTIAAATPTVSVVKPKGGTGGGTLNLPGDVQAFYEAPLFARVNGYLRSWNDDIGARVKRGDVIATIETPDLDQQLDQAKGELGVALARQHLAEITAARWNNLLGSNSVSRQSADEKAGDAEAARAVVAAQKAHVQGLEALESFKRLVAPFNGVVTARNTDVGALINGGASGGAPLFKVADLHEMRVYVRAPQAYAGELTAGLPATLTEPQYVGEHFPARLLTTSNSVALDSRTVLVELLAPNPDGRLWPGTYAEVTFALPGDARILRVPTSAVIFREHGAQLAVMDGPDHVRFRDVKLGRNFGTEIEVLSGVDAEARVVNNPLDSLQDGERVNVAGGGKPAAQATGS